MNPIEILKSRANEAWAADDGQMTAEEVALATARKAVSEGLIQAANVGLAAKLLAEHLRQSAKPEIAAVAPMELARRKAESDWQAAVNAAKRAVTVHDEDGGTSVEMRVPSGWTHDGCSNLEQYLRKVVPGYVEAQAEQAGASDAEAERFVAALPSMDQRQAKAAYWALSNEARLSRHIRALPKAVRRSF